MPRPSSRTGAFKDALVGARCAFRMGFIFPRSVSPRCGIPPGGGWWHVFQTCCHPLYLMGRILPHGLMCTTSPRLPRRRIACQAPPPEDGHRAGPPLSRPAQEVWGDTAVCHIVPTGGQRPSAIRRPASAPRSRNFQFSRRARGTPWVFLPPPVPLLHQGVGKCLPFGRPSAEGDHSGPHRGP